MDAFERDRVEIAIVLDEYKGIALLDKIEELCEKYYLRGYNDCMVIDNVAESDKP